VLSKRPVLLSLNRHSAGDGGNAEDLVFGLAERVLKWVEQTHRTFGRTYDTYKDWYVRRPSTVTAYVPFPTRTSSNSSLSPPSSQVLMLYLLECVKNSFTYSLPNYWVISRIPSSGMLRRVALVRTYVSDEYVASLGNTFLRIFVSYQSHTASHPRKRPSSQSKP
jgi:hypothetical protein